MGASDEGEGRRTLSRLLSPRPWLVGALGSLALLAATGGWLSVRYRPERVRFDGHPNAVVGLTRPGGGLVHTVHVVLAVALYVALAGLVVVLLLDAVRSGRRIVVVFTLAGAMIGATLLARSSGGELRWSALALWAVRVNSRYDGVWRAAFDPVVRFVLTDREVRPADYRVSVVTHVFAAPILLAIALTLAWATVRRTARGRASRD